MHLIGVNPRVTALQASSTLMKVVASLETVDCRVDRNSVAPEGPEDQDLAGDGGNGAMAEAPQSQHVTYLASLCRCRLSMSCWTESSAVVVRSDIWHGLARGVPVDLAWQVLD